MGTITRRNFVRTAAASLAMPAIGRRALAAEPLKVGYVYLGAIGDFGWTWAHEKGRKAMLDALKGQVVADYVENVKEDASAIPIMKDLAQQGHKLIFATSFGYMDQTIEVAKQFPDVKFEHCTGFKRADNVGTYNSRFHQGRAVEGTLAGMMSKTGVIGYLGSFKIPEVVMGVNSFTLSAQAINPNITIKLVMIDTWFDPAKEAAAAADACQSRLRLHRHPHRQPGRAAGLREEEDLWLRPGRRHVALRAARAPDRDRGHLGPLLHLARQGDARQVVDAGRYLVGHQGGHRRHLPYNKPPARQRARRGRQDHRRLEGRLLRRLHRPDLRSDRHGESQPRASG